MASEFELRNSYTLQYQELLDTIESFDLKYPDDVNGHNVLVKLAKKVRERAVNVGLTTLDPLPEKK
jgi:hypothetical protein